MIAKIFATIVIAFFSLSSVLLNVSYAEKINSDWTIAYIHFSPYAPILSPTKIRTGLRRASTEVAAKGTILYLEGLGDSFMNHGPLFDRLTSEGYNILSFDYMGQGGSKGSMNHTRVLSHLTPGLNIKHLAEKVWSHWLPSLENDDADDKNSLQRKKLVLGWSTGGLAAYEMASSGWADAVVLIAPGICPSLSVGAGLLKGNKITLSSLTSATEFYGGSEMNPHVDPIRPASPLWVPLFSQNLVLTSLKSRFWKIPKTVKGLVFHSGENDTYVKTQCNRKVVSKNAPHFKNVYFEDALHEIDNEVLSIRLEFADKLLAFLKEL